MEDICERCLGQLMFHKTSLVWRVHTAHHQLQSLNVIILVKILSAKHQPNIITWFLNVLPLLLCGLGVQARSQAVIFCTA